jgi:urea transport system substrate-binding protein
MMRQRLHKPGARTILMHFLGANFLKIRIPIYTKSSSSRVLEVGTGLAKSYSASDFNPRLPTFFGVQPMMNRRGNLKALAAAAALSVGSFVAVPNALAQNTIKVGVLHSLSGTMAISETVLKDTVLMAIDEINAKGGVLGKKLEPVVVDPASNWPLFAEKTKQLLGQDKVSVIFGCWTSVSRKSVLPVVEEMNGLLFYPVQYEGEELSKNVFYTGAAPNQQAIPAVDYLMSKDGGAAKRWVLLGTDYVYPRTTNKILRAYLKSKGVKDTDIDEKYTPFGHSDYQTIVADIKKFSTGGKTAVVSTINGDSNVPFYKELGNAGLKAKTFQLWLSQWVKKSCAVWTPSLWSVTWPHGTIS